MREILYNEINYFTKQDLTPEQYNVLDFYLHMFHDNNSISLDEYENLMSDLDDEGMPWKDYTGIMIDYFVKENNPYLDAPNGISKALTLIMDNKGFIQITYKTKDWSNWEDKLPDYLIEDHQEYGYF